MGKIIRGIKRWILDLVKGKKKVDDNKRILEKKLLDIKFSEPGRRLRPDPRFKFEELMRIREDFRQGDYRQINPYKSIEEIKKRIAYLDKEFKDIRDDVKKSPSEDLKDLLEEKIRLKLNEVVVLGNLMKHWSKINEKNIIQRSLAEIQLLVEAVDKKIKRELEKIQLVKSSAA